MKQHTITQVKAADLSDLLPLMRGYCDFYGAAPTDMQLLTLSRALIADPSREGIQLIARAGGSAQGFATVFWTWSTLDAARLGVMNDLFVKQDARGQGLAEQLIEQCRAACARHGATRLAWQTAADNSRAQAVYNRVGGVREEWVDYWLDV